ncbi:unnamed protein product [Parnassius apollo]|uniref:(apollo) hypothetical protein n=1 Tax=Parnassius apollo TaxID=110799 RepID=A0A8S3XDR0_PARAO|nr:unnamed protein product [Parnassius apollo]
MASRLKLDNTAGSLKPKTAVTTAGVMSTGTSSKRVPSTTGGNTSVSPTKSRTPDISLAHSSFSTPESSPASLFAKANRLYQEAKTQIEQSGNIKTSIKETVLSNIAGMYEIILRLSESRQTLQVQLEKSRAENAATLLKHEREHAEQLSEARKHSSLPSTAASPPIELMKELIENLRDHTKTVVECQKHTITLTEQLKQPPQNNISERTYAQAVGTSKHQQNAIKEEIAKMSFPPLQVKSYASVASTPFFKQTQQSVTPATKPAIILTPTTTVNSREEIMESWRKSICLKKLTMHLLN